MCLINHVLPACDYLEFVRWRSSIIFLYGALNIEDEAFFLKIAQRK